LMSEHPDLFWGVICSMYLGNVMLLILNLPLIGLWVRVLSVPYAILFPMILLICLIGAYSLNGSLVEMVIMVLFGIIGYLMKKLDYEIAPVVLAMVLGTMMEPALRQSMMMSNGQISIFFTRPVSLVLMIITAGIVVYSLFMKMVRRVKEG